MFFFFFWCHSPPITNYTHTITYHYCWELLYNQLKNLDLDEDEDFDDDNFEALVYADEGRLNQWYSFAGEYSVNGTLTINTETGDFTDSADYTTAEYSDESKSGNVFKDKKENIFERLGVEKWHLKKKKSTLNG